MLIKVKKIGEDAILPQRASNYAVGYDLFAFRVIDPFSREPTPEQLPIEIAPGKTVLIGIGVKFAVPFPVRGEILPRSGLAAKYRIVVANAPGTLDPDYTGECGILLWNCGTEPFRVQKGDRIAQMIFSQVEVPVFEEVSDLPQTIRGTGGFGSTGLREIKEGTLEYRRRIREQDVFYMKVVLAVAERSNCVRGVPRNPDGTYQRDEEGSFVNQTRKFGCVIVKDDNIISMGYNAQHSGSLLCAEVGCLREAEGIPSGTRMERCRAVHAEWMAISKMLVSGVGASTRGATMYMNTEPCEVCAKLIAEIGIETMVVLEGVYPTNGTAIVRQAGIDVRYVKLDEK